MEEQKYFTPNVEDFHKGYEYEILELHRENYHVGFNNIISKWIPKKWDSSQIRLNKLACKITSKEIRVPYLTKKQIENEGWKETELTKKVAGDYKRKAFIKNNYFLIWDTFRDSYIEITLIDPSKDYRFMIPENFKCTMPCKDINELRYICKLLKI